MKKKVAEKKPEELKFFELTQNEITCARACSTDETRFNINGVKFEDRYCAATNGHYLVIMKREDEPSPGLAGKIVDVSRLRVDPKARAKNAPEVFYKISEIEGKYAGASGVVDVINAEFPDWTQAIPKNKTTIRVSLDPHKLLELAQAMGIKKGSGVELEICADEDVALTGIGVRGMDNKSVGFLMPMRFEDQLPPSKLLKKITEEKA